MNDFTDAQIERYARHIILPQVGGQGQRRLLDARVLVVGAGGLGSPAALYLAAAGVGTLGIADDDVVDAGNLQRQVIHSTPRIGSPKTESAASAIRDLNPDATVVEHRLRLDSSNAMDVLSRYDVVVDGSDNFSARYLIADATHLLGLPMVHGAIFQFEGQVATFDPARDGSPCYRCLFPSVPPPGSVPNCAQAGVFGVLAGVIGCLQAAEVVKLICRIGEPLTGKLLLYDALEAEFTRISVACDARCPLCGPSPTITSLADYETFCGVIN